MGKNLKNGVTKYVEFINKKTSHPPYLPDDSHTPDDTPTPVTVIIERLYI